MYDYYDYYDSDYSENEELPYVNLDEYLHDILNYENSWGLCKPYFKVIRRRHCDFVNYKKKIECPIDLLHIIRPKVNVNNVENQYFKYYVELVKKLLDINKTESITKLIKFNGDVYSTIIFG